MNEFEYARLSKDPQRMVELQNEQIKRIQDADAKYYQDKDINSYILFWEDLWAKDGLLIRGANWSFKLADLYIKQNRYEDALRALKYLVRYDFYLDCEEKIKKYLDEISRHCDIRDSYSFFEQESNKRQQEDKRLKTQKNQYSLPQTIRTSKNNESNRPITAKSIFIITGILIVISIVLITHNHSVLGSLLFFINGFILAINITEIISKRNYNSKSKKILTTGCSGCGTTLAVIVLFTIVIANSPLAQQDNTSTKNSSTETISQVSSVKETSSMNTSTELESNTNTTVETDANSEQSFNAESKAESKTELKAKSESSSKAESSSKLESKRAESKVESFVLKDYLFIIDDRDNTFHMINCPKIQRDDIPAGKWHAHDDKGYDNEDMISLMEFGGYHVCSECKDLIKPYDPDEFIDTVSKMNQETEESSSKVESVTSKPELKSESKVESKQESKPESKVQSVVPQPQLSAYVFYGNMDSMCYHTKNCQAAQKISDEHRFTYTVNAYSLYDAEQVARQYFESQGYQLCGICARQ